MQDLLFQLLILCSAAIIFVPLFSRLRLGPILAYLFPGLLFGPMVLGLIKDPESILHFSEFGVVFLLFIIGLELAPQKFWQLSHSILGFGLRPSLDPIGERGGRIHMDLLLTFSETIMPEKMIFAVI